jgi:hypothetical protein
MTNQNNRPGSSDATSNKPADKDHSHKGGGNMGAGKSGEKSFGAEKPEERDNAGSRQPGQ